MGTEQTPQAQRAALPALARELTIERIAFFAYIALTIAYMLLIQRGDHPWAIYVDGKRVAVAPNRPTAAALLAEARAQESHRLPGQVRFKQDVEPRFAGWRAKPDGLVDALSAIERVTTVQVWTPAILVNGRPTIGAPSRAVAADILDAVKQRYAAEVESLYEEPRFKEKVRIGGAWLSPQRVFRDAEAGAGALAVPEGRPITHAVRSGELAMIIAEKYNLPLHTLRELNPGRNLDRLQIGDVLRVGAGESALTVIVKEARKAPGGGRKIVTYENGMEVRRAAQ